MRRLPVYVEELFGGDHALSEVAQPVCEVPISESIILVRLEVVRKGETALQLAQIAVAAEHF
jgi:hypothetical protein